MLGEGKRLETTAEIEVTLTETDERFKP